MNRDITATPEFKQAEALLSDWFQTGSGQVADLSDISLSPDARTIAGAGAVMDKLDGVPSQRICLIDVGSGAIRIISNGPRNDRMPRWDADGKRIAYLSDAAEASSFQLQIYDVELQTQNCFPLRGMWVEYIRWSPDGARLLLGAAGTGVDLAGVQGGIPSPLASEVGAGWKPEVDLGTNEAQWRSVWIHDPRSGAAVQVSPPGINVWEATWCGSDAVICVASDAPGEEHWYRANLRHIDLTTGTVTVLYEPKDQIGWPSASPSGEFIAIAEAVCSDRTIVAGDLYVAGANRDFQRVRTGNVDVTFTAWQGEHALMYAGHRDFDTVLAVIESFDRPPREVWASSELTFGSHIYPEAAPARSPGHAAILVEGFFTQPTLTMVGDRVTPVREFGDKEFVERIKSVGSARPRRWHAPDGLEILGWLLTPSTPGPHALVMQIHGGPVWCWRPRFIARTGWTSLLLSEGYAIFLPNVRGSSGRGQQYARSVFGDMGGLDTLDYLSGLDSITDAGLVDQKRIGVMGGSYGGFMSSWLVTQDQRFAAAIPFSPVTNWVSEHLTCHIPYFCKLFLADELTNLQGKYYSRSPILFASSVRTPTLNICGALDKNTPPGQALEFHHALLSNGIESVLVTYPQEGHGVRSFPALTDFSARVLQWFSTHMRS